MCIAWLPAAHKRRIGSLAFSCDGKYLASAGMRIFVIEMVYFVIFLCFICICITWLNVVLQRRRIASVAFSCDEKNIWPVLSIFFFRFL